MTDGRGAGAASPGTGGPFLRFDAAEIADRTEGEPLGYMIENRHIRAGLAEAVTAAGSTVLAPARVARVDVRARARRGDPGRRPGAARAAGRRRRRAAARSCATPPASSVHGWTYGQTGVVATVAPGARPPGRRARVLPARRPVRHPAADRAGAPAWSGPRPTRRGAALARRPRPRCSTPICAAGSATSWASVEAQGPALRLSAVAAAGRATRRAARGAAGRRRPRHPPDRRPGPEPRPEGRRRPGRGAGRGDAARRGHRLGVGAGALRALAAVRQRRPSSLAMDVFIRLFSNDNPILRAGRGAGMAAVNRIGPARRFFMQEAGGARGRSAAAAAGRGALVRPTPLSRSAPLPAA